MKISKLKIRGYKSFGPDEVVIKFENKLAAFIGLNSAGKTSALEAIKKLFGSSFSEREIHRQDFHIGKNESPDDITSRELSIEVRIDFTKDEQEAIPHFFSEMVVDAEGGDPYLRVRLEASWQSSDLASDGEIDFKTYFIKVPEGASEEESSKRLFPNHFRKLIQVIYVPAIRKPAEQLRYASGSLLYRVLKKIKWSDEFKKDFEENIEGINEAFKELPEFNTIQGSITSFWQKFHKDARYRETVLGFGGSDFEAILKKLEISFNPTGTHKSFSIDDLGEGYRSLFYLTLVCSLLDVEDKLAESEDEETIGITRPLLTLLAIEEPENHIAPQLLGRVIKILSSISEKESSQVLLSSHTPAIIKRLDPKRIHHFRITEDYETEVNHIILPNEEDEAYKYVKQAVHNYPEIYFARLVVIGEGDSEEVIFNRLMSVMDVDFDDNMITFAPLGHRFVNHIWRLLNTLHIPYVTLLDLDLERQGGGWGRIKYALKQLLQIGIKKEKLLELQGGKVLSNDELDKMHTWKVEKDDKTLLGWVDYLKKYNVFFSSPLDIDFLMLSHYPSPYQSTIPENGGPRIPDKDQKPDKYEAKLNTAIQATLKSEKAVGASYSDEEKELMIWYNYLFLGRGKPTTHIQALSALKDEDIRKNLPSVFKKIFKTISDLLTVNP